MEQRGIIVLAIVGVLFGGGLLREFGKHCGEGLRIYRETGAATHLLVVLGIAFTAAVSLLFVAYIILHG